MKITELGDIVSQIINLQSLSLENQTEREMEAIRNDPRLKDLIGQDMPFRLEKTKDGYAVITELNNLPVFEVRVKPLSPDQMGIHPFELEFPDCIPF